MTQELSPTLSSLIGPILPKWLAVAKIQRHPDWCQRDQSRMIFNPAKIGDRQNVPCVLFSSLPPDMILWWIKQMQFTDSSWYPQVEEELIRAQA